MQPTWWLQIDLRLVKSDRWRFEIFLLYPHYEQSPFTFVRSTHTHTLLYFINTHAKLYTMVLSVISYCFVLSNCFVFNCKNETGKMKEKDERERERKRVTTTLPITNNFATKKSWRLCGEAIRPSEDETLIDLVFLFRVSHLQCRRFSCPLTFLTIFLFSFEALKVFFFLGNNGVQNQVGELSFSFYF